MAFLYCVFSLFFIVALASATDLAVLDYSPEDLASESRLLALFEKWVDKHSKNYTSSDGTSEKHNRFEVFKRNLQYIHKHNQGTSTHRLGLNRFADLTNEEFRATYLGLKGGFTYRDHILAAGINVESKATSCNMDNLPASWNWKDLGAVTPVKDQGSCGSCWAFSTIGAIEGVHAITTGELVNLSEQELVSCVHTNLGCQGGFMDRAFEWVIHNGGVNTEKGYPYTSYEGKTKRCKWFLKRTKAVTINAFTDVTPNDESALMCAVAQQPVSVAINAGTNDFQLYAGGVFSGRCSDASNDIDHAVLLVGWGSDKGKDYWIVKNSWSKEWGMGGYIHILRDSSNPRGTCGIHSMPSFPIKESFSAASFI